jgi:hypothetical protein
MSQWVRNFLRSTGRGSQKQSERDCPSISASTTNVKCVGHEMLTSLSNFLGSGAAQGESCLHSVSIWEPG